MKNTPCPAGCIPCGPIFETTGKHHANCCASQRCRGRFPWLGDLGDHAMNTPTRKREENVR
jgi:hypothetical protein